MYMYCKYCRFHTEPEIEYPSHEDVNKHRWANLIEKVFFVKIVEQRETAQDII